MRGFERRAGQGWRISAMCRVEAVVAAIGRDARFAAQGLRAATGEAFVVIELCDEAMEGAPEGERVCAGVRAGEAGGEAGAAWREAGDLAGAEIDQQVELGMRVGEGRGDGGAAGRVVGEVVELFVGREDLETQRDDVVQVYLQRRDGAEAPEDLQDDLPERVHGWEYMSAHGPVSSGERYPPFWERRWLRERGFSKISPAVLTHHFPPFSASSAASPAKAGVQWGASTFAALRRDTPRTWFERGLDPAFAGNADLTIRFQIGEHTLVLRDDLIVIPAGAKRRAGSQGRHALALQPLGSCFRRNDG